MKKVYQIKVENKVPERQVDSIKHDVKKYISRERRKKLPEDMDFWDFDCRIGKAQEEAKEVHHSAINEKISAYLSEGMDSFYLEILAKPVKRQKKEES